MKEVNNFPQKRLDHIFVNTKAATLSPVPKKEFNALYVELFAKKSTSLNSSKFLVNHNTQNTYKSKQDYR